MISNQDIDIYNLESDEVEEVFGDFFDISHQVNYEIFILEEYIKNLENYQIAILGKIDKEKNAELSKNTNKYNEENHYITDQAYEHIKEQIPRMLFNPIVITLWGFLESTLNDYANYIKIKDNLLVDFKEIKGKNPLSKYKKYFNDHCGLNISYKSHEKLINIQKLRNYIAHTNSKIEYINKEKAQELEKIQTSIKGIELSTDYIVVSYDGVLEIHHLIKELVCEIKDQVYRKYHHK